MRKLLIILVFILPFYLQAQDFSGCSDPSSVNYFCNLDESEGVCIPVDNDGDGIPDLNENFQPIFGVPPGFVDDGSCIYYGCTNPSAANYDSVANTDDDSCIIYGCMDDGLQPWSSGIAACNYNADATINQISAIEQTTPCIYPVTNYDCDGACLNDDDGDGVCNELEVLGCTDSEAYYGYNPNATDDDGSCVPVVLGCTDSGAFNYIPLTGNSSIDVNTDDGSCIAIVYGCDDEVACNYDATVNTPTESCTYAETYYDCNDVCLNDSDADGVCDELEILACKDLLACNYNSDSTTDTDNSLCIYAVDNADCDGNCLEGYVDISGECIEEVLGCQDPYAFNFDLAANTDNGTCCYVSGCMDSEAFNYNSNACHDDGLCVFLGCMDSAACNYDSSANTDDESCVYADDYYDCNDVCLNDDDGDGVCDELEIAGCTDQTYLEYNSTATDDNGSCETLIVYGCTNNLYAEFYNQGFVANTDDNSCSVPAVFGCTDNTALNYSSLPNVNQNSQFDTSSPCYYILGCTDNTALNYNSLADHDDDTCCYIGGCTDASAFNYSLTACEDDGSCIAVSLGCIDPDALNYNVNANTDDGSCCYISGCTDTSAFNYNSNACHDDGSCIAVVQGCTDETACNYNSSANTEDTCTYPSEVYLDCDGACLNDDDGDGVCNELEIPGCTDATAYNYNVEATDDNSTCIPFIYGCTSVGSFNYDSSANTDDGSCLSVVEGCLDSQACNYISEANTSDGSCVYAVTYYDCNGACLNDSDDDGVCDEIETAGCTDALAFNYDELATDDDGSCIAFAYGCTDVSAFNYDSTANTDDDTCCYIGGCTDASAFNYNENLSVCHDDGSCIEVVNGCTDASAFNYDSTANTDDGSCCTIGGCTDSEAINYNSTACYDDGSCIEEVEGCTNNTAVNYDPLSNTDNGTCCYVSGCMDSEAINYNSTACFDDGNCEYNEGCTDNLYLEFYNQGFVATIDNGSCVTLAVFGCMIESYFNYNSNANVDASQDPSGESESCYHLYGCMDETACNYNASATFDNHPEQPHGLCTYLEDEQSNIVAGGIYYDCFGECIDDEDADGICDDFEVPGCTDETACNYNQEATDDDDSCTFATLVYQCDGSCWADADGDGVCDQNEEPGCTDDTACNYNELATDDDGSCYNNDLGCGCDNPAAEAGYDCSGNCITDTDGDGVCDEYEIEGCIDSEACNYDSNPTTDANNSLCTYAEDYYDCNNDCLNDIDGDGICNELEIEGCTDANANNYNAEATDDFDLDGNGIVEENESCTYFIYGCTDSNYYEFDPEAEVDDSSCASKRGDYNLDGIVNNADLFSVLGNWLSAGSPGLTGDVNRDGIVNNADLFDVLGNWLQ